MPKSKQSATQNGARGTNGHAAAEQIPALRSDIEVQDRGEGIVDVRDPFLLQIYTLDADDFALARHFDGTDPWAIQQKLKLKRQNVSTARIRSVAKELRELKLLDTPEVWKSEPNKDNVAPYSQIHTKKRLKVLPVADESARWTCHGCGNCCHGLAVEISAEEEGRIDARLYKDILKGESFAEDSFVNADEPAKRTLRQTGEDLACIFLASDGRCWVHARQGMEAKPDACQMFPAMVMAVPGGPPRLGVRTNCGSMFASYSDGPPVQASAEHVSRIIARSEAHRAPEEVRMFGRMVPVSKLDRICQEVKRSLLEGGATAERVYELDRMHLGGRVRKAQARYAKNLLAYLKKELEGPAPVEEGAFGNQVRRLPRGKKALEAMAAGAKVPAVSPKAAEFLAKQMAHVMYLLGPLNLPDAGYGLCGILLGLLAVLHATGERGNLRTANTGFEVFMGPVTETLEHCWPILDALDERYGERLRAEL